MYTLGVLLVLHVHLVDIVRILALQEVVVGIRGVEQGALESSLRGDGERTADGGQRIGGARGSQRSAAGPAESLHDGRM